MNQAKLEHKTSKLLSGSDSEAKLSQNFIKFCLPFILWMGVIFWMSTGLFSSENTSRLVGPLLHYLSPSISPQTEAFIHGLIRKTAHITEYFVLGLLFFRAFRGESFQTWRLRWAIYAIVGVGVCALSDEFHQSFVSTRTASLVDVSIDLAGGVLSQIVMTLWNFHFWKYKHALTLLKSS
jgi:VanZ family protein